MGYSGFYVFSSWSCLSKSFHYSSTQIYRQEKLINNSHHFLKLVSIQQGKKSFMRMKIQTPKCNQIFGLPWLITGIIMHNLQFLYYGKLRTVCNIKILHSQLFFKNLFRFSINLYDYPRHHFHSVIFPYLPLAYRLLYNNCIFKHQQ